MNKLRLTIELEPFTRFGKRFFNARLIYRNSLNEEFVVNVGEYHGDVLIKRICDDAAVKQELYFDAVTNHMEKK